MECLAFHLNLCSMSIQEPSALFIHSFVCLFVCVFVLLFDVLIAWSSCLILFNTSVGLFQRVSLSAAEEVVADVSTNQLRGYLYAPPRKNRQQDRDEPYSWHYGVTYFELDILILETK